MDAKSTAAPTFFHSLPLTTTPSVIFGERIRISASLQNIFFSKGRAERRSKMRSDVSFCRCLSLSLSSSPSVSSPAIARNVNLDSLRRKDVSLAFVAARKQGGLLIGVGVEGGPA